MKRPRKNCACWKALGKKRLDRTLHSECLNKAYEKLNDFLNFKIHETEKDLILTGEGVKKYDWKTYSLPLKVSGKSAKELRRIIKFNEIFLHAEAK